MHPRSLLYKGINLVCSADITRVLLLGAGSLIRTDINTDVSCHWVDDAELATLLDDNDFRVSQAFIDDFQAHKFRGVAATLDGQLVGLLFFVSDSIAARHNSGGARFKGIGLSLPHGVFYLFKVAVSPGFRGRRVNGSMIAFAVDQLGSQGMEAIVTTTDWTNRSFLNSVEALGFQRCGFASEFVVSGKHFYQLPKMLDPGCGQVAVGTDKKTAIRFRRGSGYRHSEPVG